MKDLDTATPLDAGHLLDPKASVFPEHPAGLEAVIETPAEADIEIDAVGVTQETYAGWVELVDRIRSGVSDGMEDLYQLFSKGIRFYRGLCS